MFTAMWLDYEAKSPVATFTGEMIHVEKESREMKSSAKDRQQAINQEDPVETRVESVPAEVQ